MSENVVKYRYTTEFLRALASSPLCVKPDDLQIPEPEKPTNTTSKSSHDVAGKEEGDQTVKPRRKRENGARSGIPVDTRDREHKEVRENREVKESGRKFVEDTSLGRGHPEASPQWMKTGQKGFQMGKGGDMDDIQRFKMEMRLRQGLPIEIPKPVVEEPVEKVEKVQLDEMFTKPVDLPVSTRSGGGGSRFSKLFKEKTEEKLNGESVSEPKVETSEPPKVEEKIEQPKIEPLLPPIDSQSRTAPAQSMPAPPPEEKQQFGRLLQMLQASAKKEQTLPTLPQANHTMPNLPNQNFLQSFPQPLLPQSSLPLFPSQNMSTLTPMQSLPILPVIPVTTQSTHPPATKPKGTALLQSMLEKSIQARQGKKVEDDDKLLNDLVSTVADVTLSPPRPAERVYPFR